MLKRLGLILLVASFSPISTSFASEVDGDHRRASSASVRAEAPQVVPARPLPRESVSFRGALGKGSRPVELQVRSDGGWKRVAVGQTKDGRYALRTLAVEQRSRYRIVAPPYADHGRLATESRVLRRLTGQLYWHWNDQCRGSSDPEVYERYCRLRDSAMRRGGYIAGRDFHTAWRQQDEGWMRRLLTNDKAINKVEGSKALGKHPDCSYDADETSWLCWTKVDQPKADDVVWRNYPVEVTRHEVGHLPVWRVRNVF